MLLEMTLRWQYHLDDRDGNTLSNNIFLVGDGDIISDNLKAFHGSSTPCNIISDNIFFCQRWQYHRDIRDSFLTKSASKIALWDSFAEYSLFYRSLLQKRPVILRSLLIKVFVKDAISLTEKILSEMILGGYN